MLRADAYRYSRMAGAAFVDLLLPRCCVVCEGLLDRGEREMVCGRCWARLPLLPAPKCDRCGHPTYGQHCRWCELLPPYVRAARSVCWASGHIGLGVEYRFNARTGVFLDARRVFPDSTDDYALWRFGLRLAF